MQLKPQVGIILLAAGSSSRMGHNKLLFVHKGMTLLEKALNSALHSKATRVVIVTGANREKNESLIERYEVEVVYNENWKAGIGSSIKCGLKKMLEKQMDAVIISVCDQPYLNPELFDKLFNTYKDSGKKIVASSYNNTVGVPVLYDQKYFEELMRLPDSHGAKRFLIKKVARKNVASVPFPKGEIDLDTLEDLKKMNE